MIAKSGPVAHMHGTPGFGAHIRATRWRSVARDVRYQAYPVSVRALPSGFAHCPSAAAAWVGQTKVPVQPG